MNRFRKTTMIGVLAVGAVLAVAGTSAAQGFGKQSETSAQSETPWCSGSDLVITAHKMHSPSEATTAHHIRLAAAEGVSCKIGGTLSNVRFLDAEGRDMNVQLAGGQTGHYVELPVDGTHEAAVYVASQIHGPRVNPASIQFNLPGKGSLGDSVTVAWPSGLGALVRVGDLMAPAS
ncbi:hypothetical protein [Lentzea nigeriaca]|uniref:hypothetical protein n=1 Tax=Lentzea nigeriaca TaxID=1128665 RepID=UPI0019568718|nr:hypothetical protein [Lentzea nigeriaca]MBM7859388.1 hypothetical protein [Lentzea nigeriaca]